jgi:hypothetical protein
MNSGKKRRPPALLTVGRIAAELSIPIHRVGYVLATRPHIQPAALAGNARLFDRRALALIRHEINAIDARRGGAVVDDEILATA